MSKNINKPVFVPTAYSQRTVLWSLALVALAGVLLWTYNSWSALAQVEARLAEPVSETVQMPLYSVKLPLGWEAYAKDGNTLAVFRKKGADVPLVFCHAESDESFWFHALDVNPAIVFQIVEDDIESANIQGVPRPIPMMIYGTEQLAVRPGVKAVRMLFDLYERAGEAVVFYSGNVRYVLWGLWNDDDELAAGEIHTFFRRLFDSFDIPEQREYIDRPVVDSSLFTVAHNAEILRQVARELAQWRLFSARAEKEPESALLPALVHYRESLRLLSTIRQENVALATDDFKLFKRLLSKRRQDVSEWFVVLDKAVAMGDWDKAREQAQWIISHATLKGERQDVRRAADILATKIPPEQKP
ncbi:MAG: hypothetical protein IKO55_15510 [Kiritimatiellae bacterium]|nr:hypothetical protein [Kiritimatiellia bacterium]